MSEPNRRRTTAPRALAAALVALAFAGPVHANTIPFTHVVIDSTPPTELHAKTVGDIDGDGYTDVLAAGASSNDGLYWYRYPAWTRHTIVPSGFHPFSTDMQTADVDADGDLDVVVPHRGTERAIWWYENPRPSLDPATDPWPAHLIGPAGGHDLEVGDLDGDGLVDVVAREDSATAFIQDGAGGWTAAVISTRPAEGLSLGDVDRDGDLDAAINGYWLENPLPTQPPQTTPWTEHTVDASWPARVGVRIADVDGNGRPDVVLAPSESENGRLSWYDAPTGPAGPWIEHVVDADVSYIHTFQCADMDIDGDLDLVTAEMQQSTDPDEVSVYLNQGVGLSWTQDVVATTGSHNVRVADIGSDGDLDIVGANWQGAQLLEMWRSDIDPRLGLDAWQRHVVDAARPWRAVFIETGDLDGDALDDIVTGAWWYPNPGTAGGTWVRTALGDGMNNMAALYDFDRDGDLDVLGTRGVGAASNDSLVWARNDGAAFSILENIDVADGDFLQGVAVAPFDLSRGGLPTALLSWHDTTRTVQTLDVPADASAASWVWTDAGTPSQAEALSAGDIDRDGDLDVLQGTRWLRNDGPAWTPFVLAATPGEPDRNRLADVDGDGDLDAVVGFQAVSAPGALVWYEQGASSTAPWSEHVIATVTGPMSLDVADMDHDGDADVVVGEHDLASPGTARLIVFENAGAGAAWGMHVVYTGDEHHDGARVADLDRDGDLDIVSIGWGHDQVLLYENLALAPGGGGYLNDPPVVALSAAPTSGPLPLTVDFDASGSYDPDGDPIAFAWDFGDGSPADTGMTATHAYTTAGTYDARIEVSDGMRVSTRAVSIFAGTVTGPSAGLIHHWRFDEGIGTTAGDSAGTADGTFRNGAAWSPDGRLGASVMLDGVDGAVDLGPLVVTGGLTLALWFRADDFDVYDGRFISKATGTATADHTWMLSTIDGTALRFRLRAQGMTDVLATPPGMISAGVWTHIAATYDGEFMRIFKDGVEVATMPKTGPMDPDSLVSAAIGNQPAGAGNLPFDGRIDDVRIYDRALSAAEIDSLVTYRLFVGVDGAGAVQRAPNAVAYMGGSHVEVTAVPQAGWAFAGWTGALSGAANPDTVVVEGDVSVTATFVPVQPIPTAGEFALGAMLLLLLLAGARVLRARGAFTPARH